MRRFLFVVALLASACRPSARREPFTLRLAVVGPLAPLGPYTSESPTTVAQDLVFEGLLAPDAAGRLGSKFARRFEKIDATRYRLEIEPSVRFSDGSAVAADDIARAIEANGGRVTRSGNALVVDSAPMKAPIEQLLLFTTVFKQVGGEFIGTGRFRVIAQGPSRIVLERPAPPARRIARVELVAYDTPRDAFSRALRGDCNGAVGMDRRQQELMEDVPSLKLVRSQSPHVLSVLFNARTLGIAERRALARALPVREIAAAAAGGECLAEAPPGDRREPLPPGRPLRVGMNVAYSPDFQRAALALRRALQPRSAALGRWSPDGRNLDVDLVVVPQLVWPPVMRWAYLGSGAPWNWFGYSSPALETALERGDEAAASAALDGDPPGLYLCRRERVLAVDSRIVSATLSPWGWLETLPDWEVAP